jgi:transcriptional antiterminator NusG
MVVYHDGDSVMWSEPTQEPVGCAMAGVDAPTFHSPEDIQDLAVIEGVDIVKYLNPRYKWYIVNTYSGSEESVKLSLRERILKASLMDAFGEVVIPKMSVERSLKSGKKKVVSKTSFPGYVIVQMDLNDLTMNCVLATPKVTGFVGNKRHPRPMPDRDVLRLVSPQASRALRAKETVVVTLFKKGEMVKVADGPFTNFDGVIDEVKADKMKLKVLVSIFGRETPVELNYAQVTKVT